MSKTTSEVTINKPLQAVWDYINNPDNMPEWLDNFKEYERLTGDPDNPKPGDTGRHTYNERGRDFVMEEEMLEYDAPHHVKLKLTSSWFDLVIVNDLEEVNGNTTKLTASSEFTRTSVFMKVMMLFRPKSKTNRPSTKFRWISSRRLSNQTKTDYSTGSAKARSLSSSRRFKS